jgi:fused signal recognition particle receptor
MWWIVGAVALTAVVAAVILLRRRRRSGGSAGEPAGDPAGAPERGPWSRLRTLLGGEVTDWTRVEEVLLAGDVGAEASAEVVERARRAVRQGAEPAAALRAEMVSMFGHRDRSLSLRSPLGVIVVVGVNGSGKTTTIAKLASMLLASGSVPLLAAADTFRAAAGEQLHRWGERLGVDVVGGSAGGDPAAVAFDALAAARARGRDVLIVDTAGRLHSKSNLMDELGKVVRVLAREAGSVDEVLLVVDGTTGQNAIAQAEAFTAAVGVTGVVLTKLDGTARGGMALAVEHRLGIPVKFVGTGEHATDLLHFVPEPFVERLLEGS